MREKLWIIDTYHKETGSKHIPKFTNSYDDYEKKYLRIANEPNSKVIVDTENFKVIDSLAYTHVIRIKQVTAELLLEL